MERDVRGLPESARLMSVESAPVAVVTWRQTPSDEEDQVNEPPDAQASQRQQLAHSGTSVAQAEAVHSKAAQEEGVQQSGDEIVSGVLDARHISSEELFWSCTLNPIQCSADNRCVVHIFVHLAAKPNTAVPHLLES